MQSVVNAKKKAMTLVEVLLASVMASGMMLALSQSLQTSQRTVKRTMLKSNFSNMMHLVRQGLNDPAICREAMRRFENSGGLVSRDLVFTQNIALTSLGLVSRAGGAYAPMFRVNTFRNDYKALSIELRRIFGTSNEANPADATQVFALAYLDIDVEEGSAVQVGQVTRRSSGFIPGGAASPTGMTPDTIVVRLTLNATTGNILSCSADGADVQSPGLFDCISLDRTAKTINAPTGGHKRCSLVQLGLNPLGETTALGSLAISPQGAQGPSVTQNPANGLQFRGARISLFEGALSVNTTVQMNANVEALQGMSFNGNAVWSGTSGRVESWNREFFRSQTQTGIDSPDDMISLQVNGSLTGLEPVESKLLVTRPSISFGGLNPIGSGDVLVDGPINIGGTLRVNGSAELGDVDILGLLDTIGDVEVKGDLRSETSDIKAGTVFATGIYQLKNTITMSATRSFNLSRASPTPAAATAGIKFDRPLKLEGATNQGGNVPFKCATSTQTGVDITVNCSAGFFAMGSWASCASSQALNSIIPLFNNNPVTGGSRPNGWKATCTGGAAATLQVSCCRY